MSETSCQSIFDKLSKPAWEDAGLEMPSAVGVGLEAPRIITGRKPAARTISTGTDGHDATM